MACSPRQSQACRTCKTRRTRCDLAQPVCTACRISGFRCVGFRRKAVFINTTAIRQELSSSVLSSSSESLSRYADQQKYIGFFWTAYLPHGQRFPLEAGQYTTCGWTNVAQALSDRVEVIKLAMMANSLCMLGSQHREGSMTKEGHLLFGKALGKMRLALRAFTEDQKDGLIIASRLLTMFMVLFGSNYNDQLAQSQAWESLNAGEMALFLSGKPELYDTGIAHQTFVDARLHLVGLLYTVHVLSTYRLQFIPSIVSRTKSILHSDDWMTAPWSRVSKTPLDELVDLVAKVSMLRRNPNDLATKNADYYVLITELESWMDEKIPKLGVDKLLTGGRKPLLTTELAKAHALMLFWTTCLLLRTAISFTTAEMEISSRFDPYVLRYNILRILVFFFRQEAGWFGVNVALFPLRSIYETLDTYPLSRQEERLMESLSKEYKGKEVSGFVLSMTHYRSKFFSNEK